MTSENDEKHTLSINGIFPHQKKGGQYEIQHHEPHSFSTGTGYSSDDACYETPLRENPSLTFSISKEEERLLSQSESARAKLTKKAGRQSIEYCNKRESPNLNEP